ncbi:amidohydrolase family protein [Pusillimonas sp. TS35]|nr:amidohydrolase family protein [Pusillimonas sp. TS35]
MTFSHTNRAPQPFAYSAGVASPRTRIPNGACDCHIHVYDSTYPAASGATLLPPDASVMQYQKLQSRLGTQRAVLVTPSTYGNDNRCLLAGLAQMGDSVRGVAVIDGSETDDMLQTLHSAGVRGVRLNLSLGVVGTVNDLVPLAHRIAELGWHIQLLMAPDQLACIGAMLHTLPTQIVFDHMGRLSPYKFVWQPAHALILRLLYDGKAWVKLSGGYLLSRTGNVNDPYLTELARSYIKASPCRVIWGSDWPHATASAGQQAMPDDAEQLDRLSVWADDEAVFNHILVNNPANLYGFNY